MTIIHYFVFQGWINTLCINNFFIRGSCSSTKIRSFRYFYKFNCRSSANLLSSITVLFVSCLYSLFISASSLLNFFSFSFFSFSIFSFSNSSISTSFIITSTSFCLAISLVISSFSWFFGSFRFSSFSISTSSFSNLFLAISCYCYCYFLLYLENCTGFFHLSVMVGKFRSEIDKQKRRKQKMKNVVKNRRGYHKELKEIREQNEVLKRELMENDNDRRRDMRDRVIRPTFTSFGSELQKVMNNTQADYTLSLN